MSISKHGQRGRNHHAGWGALLAGATLALSTNAAAQNASEPREAPGAGPASELRLDLMLGSDQVFSDSFSGVAWEVQPNPGRRLVQLPMTLVPGEEAGTLSEPALSFGGGRFIGWWLPGGEAAVGGRGQNFRGGRESDGPTDAQLQDLANLLADLDTSEDPRRASRDNFEDPATAVAAVSDVPAGAPRLAREVTVTPGGRVAWEASRTISGGTVRSGEDPYLYYLDGARLREQQPERPERVTRNQGESSREYSLRRRESDAAYREEAGAFRELADTVRSLPTEFEDDLPGVVWALFEVNSAGGDWTMRDTPSGNWSMQFEEFELLQQLAGGGGSGRGRSTGDGVFSAEDRATIAQLAALSRDGHPWTQRMLAGAVAGSGFAGRCAEGDEAYALIDKVLRSEDTLARNRMVYALAATDPATAATAGLLEQSADASGDPAVQLAALRAQLSVQLAQDEGSGRGRNASGGAGPGLLGAINATNANLTKTNGPDAGLVIRQFLASVPTDTEDAVNAAVGGVRFDQLSEARFDSAVAAVLSSAGDNPAVVGGWLDRQLLGSSNPDVVNRTLALMSSADAPAPVVTPLADGLRAMVFGPPEAPETPEAPEGEAGAQATTPVVTMTAGLPLDSTNHALFKLLNSGDPELRKQGWRVLRHFELTDANGNRGRGRSSRRPSDDASEADPLMLIVDAGLGQPDTPDSLVPFLLRQPDEGRADGALVRVVSEGDVPSSGRAARALLGSQRQLGTAISELDADAKERLVNRVYDRLGTGPEPVAGLIRGERSRLADWFGQQWAAGELPAPAAWAEEAGGEDALLRTVGGEDEAEALGALAALAAAAGADRDQQFDVIDRFKDQRLTLTGDDLAEAWGDAKRDIYTRALSAAAGEYRLVMTVIGEAGEARAANDALGGYGGYDDFYDSEAPTRQDREADTRPRQQTVLGVISIEADGRSVAFGGGTPALTVPDERLALRIEDPGQLLAFSEKIEALQGLPLDNVEEPLDLLPEDGDAWRGAVDLEDGRAFELWLQPWTGAKPAADEAEKPDDAEQEASGDGASDQEE